MKKTLSLLAIVACDGSYVICRTSLFQKSSSAQQTIADFVLTNGKSTCPLLAVVELYGGESDQWLGGDLGVNYFWSQYFGVGIDNSVVSELRKCGNTATGADVLQADLIARYPICSLNLAPYAMVGGGAHWGNHTQGNGNVGGGLEYRFTHNVGVFADCRWLYGESGNMMLTMAMPRVGVRLAF